MGDNNSLVPIGRRIAIKTIWKYQIPIGDWWDVTAPAGSFIHSTNMQGNTLCAWLLVDTERESSVYRFRIAGTGHRLGTETQDDMMVLHGDVFRTTVFYKSLVFHIFAWEQGQSDHA